MSKLPTTGKYSVKPYQCDQCQYEFETGTNHWGEIYGSCIHCRSRGVYNTAHCTESIPDGYERPEKWKKACLGDFMDFKKPTL